MRESSKTSLRVDCLAREIPGRVALIAGGIDADAEHALQLCRDLHEVLESGDYRLRMVAEAPTRHAAGFTGTPMTSRFASRCAVCGDGVAEGEAILYDRDARRAAYQRCGEVAE